MASRSRHSSRTDRDSDSMEAIKPLVVLVLFGTILYGAYSVVQKGPASPGEATTSVAPAFAPPPVEMTASPQPAAPSPQAPPVTSGPVPTPTAVAMPSPVMPAPPIPTMPAAPPVASMPAAAPAATTALAAAGAAAAAKAVEQPAPPSNATTYLSAESAPPPVQESVAAAAAMQGTAAADRPDRYATLSSTPPVSAALLTPGAAPQPTAALQSSAAFTTAWTDAHEKLAAGRYAEALAALSIWHDDPSLGLEESQRLEDLLGQLAGTVIYSHQDLLHPPHVVAPGETLPAVAMPLGISWQLLGKINGVANPTSLVPGEHLKVVRGPFDAVVSISRRRLTLQLGGYYAGNFPVVVGRSFLPRVGSSIAVAEVRRAPGGDGQSLGAAALDPATKPAIVLAEGLVIESAEDTGMASDASPASSLVVSVRDFADLLDILGPGSKVLIRQ
ncbi:MAG: LysM peptidoglycan-binding domain-containing protein [Planctomycetaceae bacterium]